MSSDIKESERLSDDELIGQMCTMIFAGHETTATQLGWILLALSQDQALQKRLRDEVNEYMVGRDELGYEELHSMPLLEAVVKEILRLIPPVHATARSAAEDCVVPLSKDYKTQDGKGTFNSVTLTKGQDFSIPIYLLNTSKEIWGPGALEFKPERWFNLPETVKKAGFPMEIMTFLAGETKAQPSCALRMRCDPLLLSSIYPTRPTSMHRKPPQLHRDQGNPRGARCVLQI